MAHVAMFEAMCLEKRMRQPRPVVAAAPEGEGGAAAAPEEAAAQQPAAATRSANFSIPPPQLMTEQVMRTLLEEGATVEVSLEMEADGARLLPPRHFLFDSPASARLGSQLSRRRPLPPAALDRLMELVRSGEAFAVLSNDTDFAIARGSRLVLMKQVFARYAPGAKPRRPGAGGREVGARPPPKGGPMRQGRAAKLAAGGGQEKRGLPLRQGGKGVAPSRPPPPPLTEEEQAELRRATDRATTVVHVQSPEQLAQRLGLPAERLVDLGILLGNDLTRALVDRHGVHARLAVRCNKWGMPDVESMAKVLAEREEVTAEAVPALCGLSLADELEWRAAVAESRALFAAAEPMPVGEEASDDRAERSLGEAAGSSGSGSGASISMSPALRALIRGGVCSGALPTFAAGVTETGRRYLATVLFQSWEGEAAVLEAALLAAAGDPGAEEAALLASSPGGFPVRGVGGLVEAHRRLRARIYGLLGLPFPVLEYVWRSAAGGGWAEGVCEDLVEPQPMLDLASRAVTLEVSLALTREERFGLLAALLDVTDGDALLPFVGGDRLSRPDEVRRSKRAMREIERSCATTL